MRLRGSVAIVTGASGGIGSTTVRALLQQGAVVVAAAPPDATLEALAGQLHDRNEGRSSSPWTSSACRKKTTFNEDEATQWHPRRCRRGSGAIRRDRVCRRALQG
ncbi:MAG: SDR family NAD(P)-dependent oxidoreductase [Candidatus Eremiobacteraeota bacterium]|nr:SDR family NAD(P)-dependent oxidoreductase [Candidatus Eremiobacteraeota bacterium]